MSRLFDNLLKAAGVGAILYGAYKLGEKNALSKLEDEGKIEKDLNKPKTEIDVVYDMIQELKKKVGKTRKDRDNIELLEIKHKQLKNRL
jgi:hypothetical protein